ncbi:hypothetical protein CQA49_08985 [Helicobacter sp. MIT 00-7814]|uniref:Dna2/Cas4 domain-containing protein n=1 Tax=unclassified Helicobacter TaxID=2593540 RepID=UPI000E1E4D3D|nr:MULTISPECIES: Dna2/Cas4 domain-containing protein [unclassified Helicobacter]RDU51963.1 hypothetical protein CQA49_08985 [Helicobacter sp. MIT 00-7814]RDU54133.1 hypothetical protein CQA37_05840 [Helicobacter sp. MIT 99-10781]
MATVNTKFLEFFDRGLVATSKLKTQHSLGDRSLYVGSSDIGMCMRKAVLSKIQPVEHSAKQEQIFARGHNAELIVEDAFKGNNTPFETQVEVSGAGELSFIKTHIDFVADFGKEKVVIECKSTNNIPSEPYSSWVMQTTLQVGLLKAQGQNCTRGIIVVLNVNTGDKTAFDVEFSEALYQVAITRAKTIWDSVQNKAEPEGECGPICGFCQYKASCQALHKNAEELPEELVADALAFADLQAQQKELGKKSDELKNKLIGFMSSVGMKKTKAEGLSLSYTEVSGRVGVDTRRMQSEAPEVFERFKTVGKPYSMLKIS